MNRLLVPERILPGAAIHVIGGSNCSTQGQRSNCPSAFQLARSPKLAILRRLGKSQIREQQQTMAWWLPIVIFFAEACVVTFSTLRTIFVARGMKPFAACLGLVEASIWLFAISQVVSNLQHIPCSIAYALGFVSGNYLG